MKGKIIAILGSLLVILVILTGSSMASENGYGEPAPNAGDCDPDGSGFEEPNGPSEGPGPAPSSGDGDPDGPGW